MNPEEIRFACPDCGQHISAFAGDIEVPASCPSCNASIKVPARSVAQSEPLPPQTTPPNPDFEKFNGARAAFLVLPLYMLGLLLLLPALWESMPSHSGAKAKLFFYLAIPLVGIAIKSLQCVAWLSTNPFRAVAIGRYLFGVYIAAWALNHLVAEWPTAKIEGPLDGVIPQQIGYGYSYQSVLVVRDPSKFQRFEPSTMSYLGFLIQFGGEIAEKGAILAFLITAYKLLRNDRPEYDWDHFCHDVSFGKIGKNYGNWNATGAAAN